MSAQLAEQNYRRNLRGELVTINDRYLRAKDVVEKCGVSRAQIYRLMGELKFPKSFNISTSIVVWLEADIEEFMRLGAEKFFEVYGQTVEVQ